MIKLTEHFSFEELTTTSHTNLLMQNRLEAKAHFPVLLCTADMLEKIRTLLNTPLTITSGFRNFILNRKVGGSKTSRHLSGLAADFIPKNMTTEEAFNIILNSELTCFRKVIIEGVKGKFWIHITVKLDSDEPTQFFRTDDGKHYEEVFR